MSKEEKKDEQQINHTEKENIDAEELIDNLPDKKIKSLIMSSSFHGSLPSPIASKINEQHIDKILESSDNESKRK